MIASPNWWEVFHRPQNVPRSRGLNQWDRTRAHGGKPMPWNQPLRTQHTIRTPRAEFMPKATLAAADSSRPRAMK